MGKFASLLVLLALPAGLMAQTDALVDAQREAARTVRASQEVQAGMIIEAMSNTVEMVKHDCTTPLVGIVIKDLKIVGALDGGLADRAGIKPGDIVASIGAVAPSSDQEALEAIEAAESPVKIVVRRGRKSLSFSIGKKTLRESQRWASELYDAVDGFGRRLESLKKAVGFPDVSYEKMTEAQKDEMSQMGLEAFGLGMALNVESHLKK